MKPLRIAVIGVGHLGRIHARLIAQNDHAELVGVVDPSPEARAAVGAELNVPVMADHQSLLGKIDGAIVAIPSRLHYAVAHDLLANGVHVLVEKPMTLNVGDADDLIRAADEHELILHVGHVERFNSALTAATPHVQNAKYIDATRCGPFTCRSTDIGVVLDLMIHDIDVVLSLVEDEIVSVEALGAAVIGPNEDWAQARLTFAGGCVANLSALRVALEARRTMQVICRDGMATIDFASRNAKVVRPIEAIQQGELDVHRLSPEQRMDLKERLFTDYLPVTNLVGEETNALLEEQRAFAAAIRGEMSAGVWGRDGRRALDVAERILTCIAAHRWDGTVEGATGPRFANREGCCAGRIGDRHNLYSGGWLARFLRMEVAATGYSAATFI